MLSYWANSSRKSLRAVWRAIFCGLLTKEVPFARIHSLIRLWARLMLESTNAECSNTAERPNCTKALGKGELKKREKQKERNLEEDEEDKGKKCWDDTENAIFPNDKHIPTPPIRYWEEGWHISIQADCKSRHNIRRNMSCLADVRCCQPLVPRIRATLKIKVGVPNCRVKIC